MTSVVAWSRILSRREVVWAVNTDLGSTREVWVTVDASLHQVGQPFSYAYSSGSALAGTTTGLAARNGLGVRVRVAPGGIAVLTPA